MAEQGMFSNLKGAVDLAINLHPLYGNAYSDARNYILDLMDRPLNAVQGAAAEGVEGAKKGITGAVDYSYLDAMSPEFQAKNPETAAALAVAGDLVLDPMNLVGAGLFTKGTKALKNLNLVEDAYKGGIPSSASNYIENWYGPTDVVPFTDKDLIYNKALRKTSQWVKEKTEGLGAKLDTLSKKIPKITTAAEADNFYRKVKGITEWGVNAVDPVIQILFEPKAKALYAEKGINVGSQQIVRKELQNMDQADKALKELEKRAEGVTDPEALDILAQERKSLTRVYSRAKEKAVAQVGFNSHLTVQADRTGNIDDSIRAFRDTSSLTGYVPFTKEFYKEAVDNTQSTITYGKGRGKKVEPLKLSDESLDFAIDAITKAWTRGKNPLKVDNAKLMVKVANSTAGNHISDVVSKSPIQRAAKAAFVDFKKNNKKPTVDALYEKLKNEMSNKVGDVVGKTKEGVWIQSTKVGGAIIEGGINITTLVTPSGRTVSFMSDQHNFLENIPALGKVLEKSLPVDEISISQPIFGDILETNAIKKLPNAPEFNKAAREGRRTRGKSSTTGTSRIEERTMTNEQLRQFASAQASPEALKAQQMRSYGGGLLTGSIMGPEDQQQ